MRRGCVGGSSGMYKIRRQGDLETPVPSVPSLSCADIASTFPDTNIYYTNTWRVPYNVYKCNEKFREKKKTRTHTQTNNYEPRTRAIGTHRPFGIPRSIQPEASECQLGRTK